MAGMSEPNVFSLPIDERRAPEWLDEIRGERALEWVRERDAEAERALAGPIRSALEARIHEVLTSPDRIPGVTIRGQWAYNFWTDAERPRGVWRRQLLSDYLAGAPEWDELIDVDALAAAEGRSWVWHGASVLRPDDDRALIDLSEGGEDADETREFSLTERRWIPADEGGFARATSRGSLNWAGPDLVWRLSSADGAVSDSGYPLEARLVPRGADPAPIAPVVVGAPSDLGVFIGVDRTPGFEHSIVTIAHDFIHSSTWHIPHPIAPGNRIEDGRTLPVGAVRIDAPADAGIGSWREWLLVTPRTDWKVGGSLRPGGSLLVFRLEDFLAGSRDHEVLFAPDARSALRGMTATRSRLVVSTLEDVQTRLRVLAPPSGPDGRWTSAALEVSALSLVPTPGSALVDAHEAGAAKPADGEDSAARLTIPPLCTISAGAAAPLDDDRLWLTVSGFTTPTTTLLADLAGTDADASADARAFVPESALLVRRAPELFDATGVETVQRWATSADGTRIPYFLVGRPVGSPGHRPTAPTLLYAYGGFEHTTLPHYSGVIGRALLEKGGSYVVAGIRGGGEFGPAWHEAARGLSKEKSYEDVEAVARDLVERGTTTPSRLGVRGGSNGGLMAANIYVRSPLLIGAAVVQAPLLDMKRYSHLSAGSSWIAEYGDPDDPGQWETIRRFSPFHQWDPSLNYPPILLTSSTADDRVHPAHARSFAWLLREGLADVTYYENIEGGHSGAADARDRARVEALVWAFLWQTLGS